MKQVAHWVRKGRSVHEIGRFRGLETVLEVTGHKNSLFYGREGVFKVGGQDKWRFYGREGDKQKRDTLERMSPELFGIEIPDQVGHDNYLLRA